MHAVAAFNLFSTTYDISVLSFSIIVYDVLYMTNVVAVEEWLGRFSNAKRQPV